MAHDEFEKIDPRKRQSLDQQSLDSSTQPLQQEQAPLSQQQTTVSTSTSQTSLDSLPSRQNRWVLPGLLSAGVLILAAAFAAPRFLPEGDPSSNTSSPTAAESVSSAAAEEAALAEQQAKMLLEQAKLLAAEGGAEELTEAIAIAQSIPAGTNAYTKAQEQITPWNQQLLEAKATAANAPVVSSPETTPEIAQKQAELAELQRQIDQEVALVSAARQQRQAAESQISALQTQTASPPPPAPVQPAPVQPTVDQTLIAAAQQQLAQQQAQTQALRQQLNQAQTQTAALQNRQQELNQTTDALQSQQQSVSQVSIQSAQQAQPPASPQAQTQTQAGEELPADPGDPYLNVDIPTAPAPQTVAAAPPPSAPSTGNSYGFNNLVVSAPTVAIELRDNVDEDGDYVTLRVNGQTYASYKKIWNWGQVFMVPLQPGENRVEILGDKDGTGGITLEVNVAGIGNVNSRPIPEGSTASFIITRE
ncbi:MAG: hypothetical protein QNJ46_14365 [Leptolyngbyaceae cyanobacterium MO_188.B28]|nr:hypothetical protein [Leptolyngbyaceae cyanobacterium MO_188.B28]